MEPEEKTSFVRGNQFGLGTLLGLLAGAGITFALIAHPVRYIVSQPNGMLGLGVGFGILVVAVTIAVVVVSLIRFLPARHRRDRECMACDSPFRTGVRTITTRSSAGESPFAPVAVTDTAADDRPLTRQ